MIKQIFDEIASIGSTNAKMEILKKYKDTPFLKDVLYMIYSKRVKFYIKQIPNYIKNSDPNAFSLESAFPNLKKLSTREVTGHDAIALLLHTLTYLKAEDAYIVERIIDKDAKIGMASKNINKIYPKLIEETPYMGARSFSEKEVKKLFELNSSMYSQIKLDGRYCNAIIRNGEVELESRSGERTNLTHGLFVTELSDFEDGVYNGELIMKSFDRYDSNGIIISLITIFNKLDNGEDVSKELIKFEKRNSMTIEEALNDIKFVVWDKITIDEYFNHLSTTRYEDRLKNLSEIVDENNCDNIEVVETIEVSSYEEAMTAFQVALSEGEEGTILKSIDGYWVNKKPSYQIKMKLEMTIDLIVTGFQWGTKGTKNEGRISTVNMESKDGFLKSNPSGITEEMMDYITANQESLLGKIAEVKSCGLTPINNGIYSLLHPSFVRFRDDKDEADSIEDIIKNEEMLKGLS